MPLHRINRTPAAATPTPEPTTTAATPPAHLTADNLNPDSRFYVPEHLRPHYDELHLAALRRMDADADYAYCLAAYRAELAADPAAWRAVLDRLAAEGMRSPDLRDLDERGPLRYRPDAEVIRQRAAKLTDEDRLHWLHLRHLDDAERRHAAVTAAAPQRAENIRRETCEVCGVRHHEHNEAGRCVRPVAIIGAELHAATHGDPGALLVCPSCEPVVAALVVYRAAAEKLTDGRTRADAATALLDRAGR